MKFTRTLLTLTLVCILSISILPLSASAAEETVYGIGFVKGDSLRLRAQASTNSTIIANAPRNDCVVVLAKEGAWYKVNYNLNVGYMHSDYLNVLTKENAELGYGKITGTNVNLRSGPSTAHSVAATADNGEKCYIIGLNEGWYKVIYNGTTGYIRSDFLELTEIPYENQASPNSPNISAMARPSVLSPAALPRETAAPPLISAVRTFWPKHRNIWASAMSTAALPPAALTAPALCTMCWVRLAIPPPG